MRTWCGGSSPATERYIQPSKDFGGQLAQVTTAAKGARFYLADLNDNIGLLAERASAIDSHTFEAFGVPVSGGTPTVQPFGYGGDAGYYTEPIGGYPVLWNRIYDTNDGQFPSRNPIGFRGGDWESLYRYVKNNPMGWTDATGLGCSLYKYLYTGDWCASDAEYQAALDGGVDGLMCWWRCMTAKDAQITAGVEVIVVEAISFWPMGKPIDIFKYGNSSEYTGIWRSIVLFIKDELGASAGAQVARSLGVQQLAKAIGDNPVKAAGEIAIMVILIVEAILSAICASECSGDMCPSSTQQ